VADGLRAKGWDIDVVVAYRTVPVPVDDPPTADAIAFTSSSTVRNYVDAVGVEHVPPVVACIGPVTAQTAEELGLHVDVVAETATVDGLVDALVAALSERRLS